MLAAAYAQGWTPRQAKYEDEIHLSTSGERLLCTRPETQTRGSRAGEKTTQNEKQSVPRLTVQAGARLRGFKSESYRSGAKRPCAMDLTSPGLSFLNWKMGIGDRGHRAVAKTERVHVCTALSSGSQEE